MIPSYALNVKPQLCVWIAKMIGKDKKMINSVVQVVNQLIKQEIYREKKNPRSIIF